MNKITLIFLMLMVHACFATVSNYEVNSFVDLDALYTNQHRADTATLFVFDLDDTLFTTFDPLGSVGWWDWQKGLLKNDAGNPMLFTQSYEELIRIQGILYSMIAMKPTDEYAPQFVKRHAGGKSRLLALTARGIDVEEATKDSLIETGYSENHETLFAQHGASLNNGQVSSAGPLDCNQLDRAIYLRDGILFSAGQNKGEVLACLLKQTREKFTEIVFVDDTLKNNQDVESTFKNLSGLEIINVHFTKELGKEAGFLDDRAQQLRAYQQWQNIKNSIHQNIPHSRF